MSKRVMVELDATAFADTSDLDDIEQHLLSTGFSLDRSFLPVLMGQNSDSNKLQTVIVYGAVKTTEALKVLKAHAGVVNVWPDTQIAPFNVESESDLDDISMGGSIGSDKDKNTGNLD